MLIPEVFSLRNVLVACASLLAVQSAHAQIRNPDNIPYHWRTDTSKHVVDLSEFVAIAPRKTIPIIDYPGFLARDAALDHYFEHEPVIAVDIDGMARAYPLNILTMHELSNDTLAGVPILPTYCPLCNSSVVFDRRVTVNGNTRVLEFEVSGMLRHSDMVMFDRQTESWWQQLTGEAEVGHYAGEMLDIIPSMILSVKDYFETYPDGLMLDYHTHTEAEQRYGSNPYFHYDSIGNTPYVKYMDAEDVDARLPAMERVLDVHSHKHDRIYPLSEIAKTGVVNDSLDGRNFVIFYHAETVSVLDDEDISKSKQVGSAVAFDARYKERNLYFSRDGKYFRDHLTGSTWDISGHCIEGELKGERLWPRAHSNNFAFAYLAFYPDAEIYKAD